MIELTPAMATIVLGSGLLIAILLGYPLVFSLAGVALIIGFLAYGPGVSQLFYSRIFGVVTNYVFLAIPLFVFMGVMVQVTGIAERLFHAFHLWMGGLRGGLAIVTVLIGTITAACVGVITASVVMIGLIALPAMISRNYSKELACGAICSGGTLGILIPPSIMLVIYGPTASVSVGKLFMAAFVPGFLLSALYMTYIGIRSALSPEIGPPMPAGERAIPFSRKAYLLLTSLLPPAILIMAVLGSIFFGIAAPTEAAGVGALASIAMSAGYRTLNWNALRKTLVETLRVTGLVIAIAIGGSMFSGMFLGLGCGKVISSLIIGVPGGRWASFAVIMLIVFVLGMFIDWIGIIFIMVPLISPISITLGFDTLWFAMMVIINLQMAFLTPPFCPTVFVLQGIIPKEWDIDTGMIIRGVLPYVGLITVCLLLSIKFPQIILWLPSVMIK